MSSHARSVAPMTTQISFTSSNDALANSHYRGSSNVGARLALLSSLSSRQVLQALAQQRALRLIRAAISKYVQVWRRSKQLEEAALLSRPTKKRRKQKKLKSPDIDKQNTSSAPSFSIIDASTKQSITKQSCRFRPHPLMLALTSPLEAERQLATKRLLEETPLELLGQEVKHLVLEWQQQRLQAAKWWTPQLILEGTTLLLTLASRHHETMEQPPPEATADKNNQSVLEHLNDDEVTKTSATTATTTTSSSSCYSHLAVSRADVGKWSRIIHDEHQAPNVGTVGWLILLQHLLLDQECSSEDDLQLAKYRHVQWLWNERLLQQSSSAEQQPQQQPATETSNQHQPLSPLACLLKTYYHLTSHDISHDQVALQQCKHILTELLNPLNQPNMQPTRAQPSVRKESHDESEATNDTSDVHMDDLVAHIKAAVEGDADQHSDDEEEEEEDEKDSISDDDDEVSVHVEGEEGAAAGVEAQGDVTVLAAGQDDEAHEEEHAAMKLTDSTRLDEIMAQGDSSFSDSEHEGMEICNEEKHDEEHDEDDDEDVFEEEGAHDYILAGDEDEEEQLAFIASLNSRSRILGAVRTSREEAKAAEAITPCVSLTPTLEVRTKLLISESMQVLATLYPPHVHHLGGNALHQPLRRSNYLSIASELAMVESINKYVQPPKKPDTTKIIMRRAPTQEEFFGGSLSRNPIPMSILKPSTADPSYEPTVADLRQHIANDLQMSDSAELIEIIIAGKIVNVGLKLRVVNQVLWRQHLMENLSSTSMGSSGLLSTGGLSMIFSSGLVNERLQVTRTGANTITADTPTSALPSLIIMYRLAGVDGEATEDTVNTLVDPEAASELSPENREKLLEEQFKLTHLVTSGRGIHVILRSVQHTVADSLRRIRRDDVGGGLNASRELFKSNAPSSSLILLRYCCQLQSNRKLLVSARAPTLLLTLLLDVLKGIEGGAWDADGSKCPTAEVLQELIESLTCDISGSTESSSPEGASIDEPNYESDTSHDATSMTLLLESIETISLSPPLRQVIGKLLPFLTYGQPDLSMTLADHFSRNIVIEHLGECEAEDSEFSQSLVLMNTFVQTAMSLPSNEVCNPLRMELIKSGLIERLTAFIYKDIPQQPPPWSAALWSKGEMPGEPKARGMSLEEQWRDYFTRSGIRTAFKILTGLCKLHAPTQARVAASAKFIQLCHWIETTLDNDNLDISTGGLGLLAETLLDELIECNKKVQTSVDKVRQKTRMRKKELAEERRNLAMQKMSTPFASTPGTITMDEVAVAQPSAMRDAAASLLAPYIGLFKAPAASNTATPVSDAKPAWLTEMESMEDEDGQTCAICQEGYHFQPSSLLGLYAFVKKVTIASDQGGVRQAIDGTCLLKALPTTIPESLIGDPLAEEWFLLGRAAADRISASEVTTMQSPSRKNIVYTTSVSAGTAIHFTCHQTARQADRSHPKAPKSEWDGATLRNSRVTCNVIVPLVSSQSTKVALSAINTALTAHQTVITNLLGSAPKSMLWSVLHDTRFLLLRMAYGESLNADCGGGSLASNCQLLLHQFLLAEMLERGTETQEPTKHVRALPCGFLAAVSMMASKDDASIPTTLTRGVADSAPMAALVSILFHSGPSAAAATATSSGPYAKRMWLLGKDYFLRGLLLCAGRRHALQIDGSGCQTVRGGTKRARSHSFAEWYAADAGSAPSSPEPITTSARRPKTTARRAKPTLSDFQNALRPMIILYAMFDQLSADFSLNMTDVVVEEAALRLVSVIERCQRSKNIHELLEQAKIAFDHDEMIELLQKGALAA